jgi:Ca2+-binding RTX toxin-like protein
VLADNPLYGDVVMMRSKLHVPRMTGGGSAPPRAPRALLAALAILALLVAQFMVAAPVAGSPLTGGISPKIISGLADLNGDAVVDGTDDATAFYGDTSIIDGQLDCDAWTTSNDGSQGDGTIDASDDCTLVGYDGTVDGVTILVVDGAFQVADGALPTVFNAADPDNPDVSDSDFAWSTIGGRVDANGDETIDGNDCAFGIAGYDILANDGLNSCGFATAPDPADNGLVDLNRDQQITSADTCINDCFFNHDVTLGVVQAIPPPPSPKCPGYESDPRNQIVGTSGADVLDGTSGPDIICGRGGNDTIRGHGGRDLLIGGRGNDLLIGGAGRDSLWGNSGADTLRGNTRGDDLHGGRGNDRLNGGTGTDSCQGGPGVDTLRNCE